jgi:hypothetical protein
MYNGPIIRLYPAKINKLRRIKIRIPLVMDVMKGRINNYKLETELVPAEHDLD